MKRSFLTALGLEKEQIDQIMNEHGATVEILKEKHADTLTAEKEKLQKKIDALQEAIDNSPAPSADGKDWKVEHDKVKGEFDTFKQAVESEKATNAASAAVRKQLEADGANPKAIDLLLKAVDLSTVKLKDDAVENWQEISEPIKTQYADFFGRVTQSGADVGNPPAGGSPYAGKTATELMAEANLHPERMNEILSHIEAANKQKKE